MANIILRANQRLLANCINQNLMLNASITTRNVTTNPADNKNKNVPVTTTSRSGSVVEKSDQEPSDLMELKMDRALLYPDTMTWLDERQVRISKPSKNVMQSGTAYTNCWKIEFNSKERWEYWLMGWTSSSDPVSNLTMTFPTKESAIAFCEKNKLQWFVEEQPERQLRRKSYADNFSWNKRTRTSNK